VTLFDILIPQSGHYFGHCHRIKKPRCQARFNLGLPVQKYMDRLAQALAGANLRLKSLHSRCTIERRGDRLLLRGTLPPKPTATRQDFHRQRIFLGVTATTAGISFAETEARKISALLDQNLFDWTPYILPEKIETEISFDDWIAKFKEHKLAQGISEITWEKEYADAFKILENLDPDKAIAAIFAIAPNTRKRSRYCMAISALFKFAGVRIDLKPYKGNYSPTTVQPREIPTDSTIQDWYFNIKTTSWAWAFGILATYGIRPEELVLLEFEAMPILIVRKKLTSSDPKHKFQERRVYPIYPEWVELFDLKTPKLPEAKDTGKQCCKQFQRYKIPFLPYDLRHAWAIRSMEFGVPLELAAQQMGHSMYVHSQTYHRWISDRHHKAAFDTIMLKSDRLKPPICTSTLVLING
jgi:integrase